MEFEKCRWKLAKLWFIATLLLYIFVLIQTIYGTKHGQYEKEIWSWLLQCTLPTLSIIIGAFMADGFETVAEEKSIKKGVFQIAFGISLLYVLTLLSLILFQPFIGRSLFEIIKTSGLYLAPLNGLATTSIAIFFINNKN